MKKPVMDSEISLAAATKTPKEPHPLFPDYENAFILKIQLRKGSNKVCDFEASRSLESMYKAARAFGPGEYHLQAVSIRNTFLGGLLPVTIDPEPDASGRADAAQAKTATDTTMAILRGQIEATALREQEARTLAERTLAEREAAAERMSASREAFWSRQQDIESRARESFLTQMQVDKAAYESGVREHFARMERQVRDDYADRNKRLDTEFERCRAMVSDAEQRAREEYKRESARAVDHYEAMLAERDRRHAREIALLREDADRERSRIEDRHKFDVERIQSANDRTPPALRGMPPAIQEIAARRWVDLAYPEEKAETWKDKLSEVATEMIEPALAAIASRFMGPQASTPARQPAPALPAPEPTPAFEDDPTPPIGLGALNGANVPPEPRTPTASTPAPTQASGGSEEIISG